MKILVVEDDPSKFQRIEKVVREALPDTTVDLSHTEGLGETIQALKSKRFDVVILDIAIPKRKGGDIDRFGGLDLFSFEEGILENYPVDIIGLTAHDDVLVRSEDEFRRRMLACVKYDPTSVEWQDALRYRLQSLSRARETRRATETREYVYDAAIICALRDPEHIAIQRVLGGGSPVNYPGDSRTYNEHQLEVDGRICRVVSYAVESMGMVASAIAVTRMIYEFSPRIVLMTGICAGVRRKTRLQDVVIGDPIWNCDEGKISSAGGRRPIREAEPNQFRLDPEVVARVRSKFVRGTNTETDKKSGAGKKQFQIGVHPMVSSSAVVASKRHVAALVKQHRKLTAIDMEAAGVFYAVNEATRPKPVVVVVKGVSDYADEGKGNAHRMAAARNAAQTGIALVKDMLSADMKKG